MLLSGRIFEGALLLPSATAILHHRLALRQRSSNPSKSIVSFVHRRSGSAVVSSSELVKEALFVPPGVAKEEVTAGMVLPGSNIVVGPYVGDAQIKQAELDKVPTKLTGKVTMMQWEHEILDLRSNLALYGSVEFSSSTKH
ncbi:GTP-binding protein [Apostasia shenzhenica]|uniref:GTP-binding protein n=1 Tax=Apostasia shenzhenica TaxID=1088818 RepID=A0A2I0AK98_9ASPA|nr:GTP-binding protein [Apostasia shenzhenica]